MQKVIEKDGGGSFTNEEEKKRIPEKLNELQGHVAALKEKSMTVLMKKQSKTVTRDLENLANRVFEQSSKTFVARQKMS